MNIEYQVITLGDADYPAYLKEIHTPPKQLYVRGQIPPMLKAISIVGTRKLTDYGRAVTERFTMDLVRAGFVTVSGLAFGADALVHEATMNAGGKTVAVLGSGVDLITPRSNWQIAKRILDTGGAIVSEYPIGTEAAKQHFPARNRIIAGMTKGTLVTEAGEDSGALITANRAHDENRDVFAVPANIFKRELGGTNKLIHQNKAHIARSADDILQHYQMTPGQKPQLKFSSFEEEVLNYIKNGDKSLDDLAIETPYNVAKLSEVLTGLSLKGVVRQIGYNWVMQ